MFGPRLLPRPADSKFPCMPRGLADTAAPGMCDPLKQEADLDAQGGGAARGILGMSPSSALSTPVLTSLRVGEAKRKEGHPCTPYQQMHVGADV